MRSVNVGIMRVGAAFFFAVLTAALGACGGKGGGVVPAPTASPGNTMLTSGEFGLPHTLAGPTSIALGPDGAMWFTATDGNAIGRITTGGSISGYPLPSALDEPSSIVTGADGALWFTEYFSNRIGRITTAGAITEYPLPLPFSQPGAIVSAPDGAVWFTQQIGHAIGRITTTGAISEFPLAANDHPEAMTLGPDGSPWFTASNHIGHISPLGAITEYTVPTANAALFGITLGSDGALWFTENTAAKIGRVTTSGAFSEYPLPSGVTFPWQIAAGPDGAVWFLAQGYIGRISMSGVITTWATTNVQTNSLNGLTLGADGHMWYTQRSSNELNWFAVP